eukprot:TRINITY_DN12583_c0_g1_i1.p1 TRINITY_DN12583_c0_g1~~TRINITY_DN12583_c0_g1_i1.p1  ORF type:complete len:211 (+),score=49.30 TRINITY_DN12583_c0_g1_i1:207-839(+)
MLRNYFLKNKHCLFQLKSNISSNNINNKYSINYFDSTSLDDDLDTGEDLDYELLTIKKEENVDTKHLLILNGHIVGFLKDEKITPNNFNSNKKFEELMHKCIKDNCHEYPDIVKKINKIDFSEHWLHIPDVREIVTSSRIPQTENIIATVKIRNKEIYDYEPMKEHRMVNRTGGLFKLPSFFNPRLIQLLKETPPEYSNANINLEKIKYN